MSAKLYPFFCKRNSLTTVIEMMKERIRSSTEAIFKNIIALFYKKSEEK